MLNLRARRTPQRLRQAGLSLVELMVGVAIGLFVVAGATLVVSNQLGDNRRLMLETQIQQDLRAAADAIAREVRRSGAWTGAEGSVWSSGAAGVASNPYTALAVSGAASSAVTFTYTVGAVENASGFRLNNTSGAIEMLVGGNWQALTDATTLRVTSFQVNPKNSDVALSCFNSCTGIANCPPVQTVRHLDIAIAGQAVFDSTVRRTANSSVRIRNDVITGACPAT